MVYTSRALSIIKGSQDRNLEAGAEAEAMEGAAYCLLLHYLLSLPFVVVVVVIVVILRQDFSV